MAQHGKDAKMKTYTDPAGQTVELDANDQATKDRPPVSTPPPSRPPKTNPPPTKACAVAWT